MQVCPLLLKSAGQRKRQEARAVEEREILVKQYTFNQTWMGVVQNEQDLDVLLQDEQDFDVLVPTEDMSTSEDILADVVHAEPMLEVELPTEDIPADVVPTEPRLEVVFPTDDIGSDDTATIVV